jgi:aspartate 1-decarboxylase
MRIMLKSKIHQARVTRVVLDYEGSITIDKKLMEEAGILPYEQVQVLNTNNGARFTTYAIEGESGEICINGAAARLAVKGDIILILSYCHIEDDEARHFRPKVVYVDAKNAIIEVKLMVEAMPF